MRLARTPQVETGSSFAALETPACRNQLAPQDVPALWAYAGWLRSTRPH